MGRSFLTQSELLTLTNGSEHLGQVVAEKRFEPCNLQIILHARRIIKANKEVVTIKILPLLSWSRMLLKAWKEAL